MIVKNKKKSLRLGKSTQKRILLLLSRGVGMLQIRAITGCLYRDIIELRNKLLAFHVPGNIESKSRYQLPQVPLHPNFVSQDESKADNSEQHGQKELA